MENHQQFEAVLPDILCSIPYVAQSHVFKGYCALENIYAQRPRWPSSIWEHCTSLLIHDEPKVAGVIVPELLELKEISDPTAGRDFGPDWILSRGLMPLSYWAIQKKTEEIGFKALFQHYMSLALDHPRYLGHEISVLAAHWQFYDQVIAKTNNIEWMTLYSQRFTEFVVTTFHGSNDNTFDHPKIERVPSEAELLLETLKNPAFFGHNILAFVWSQRIRPLLDEAQYENAIYNVTVMTRWHSYGTPPANLPPIDGDWSEEELDDHFERYFLKGPVNTHQITLADALLWVWNNYPQYRRHVASNVECFSKGVAP